MHADTILVNANVITMNRAEPSAEAVAVKNGKILEVGTNEKITKLSGKNTKILDLHGKTVVPGLIDAHAHMIELAHPIPWVELRNVSSIKEIQRRLEAKVHETEKRKWILGRGWDQDRLKEKRLPTRWDLDEVSPNNPVLLNRVCGHIGVANSRALETSRINRKKAKFSDELIDRDPKTGEPTGILRENAMETVWELPEPTEEDMLNACTSACLEAAKAGLTSVHWFAYKPDEIQALQKLREQKKLPIRVHMVIPIEQFDNFKSNRVSDPFLSFNCIKLVTDGSLGARTAALQEPYADDPSTKGILNLDLNELRTMLKTVNDFGFQAAVHAIGDAAIKETLRAFKEAIGKADIKKHRHRIEHASVLNPRLIKEINTLGLLACIQPHFVVSDFWVTNRLGPERARWTYPFKSLIENGILVAGSSDTPVEPINPFLGIWAAVARESFPEERITVEEALEAYTVNAAYLSFEEKVKGSIEVGKYADLTVLSHNPLKVSPEKIRDIKVEMTIVGGKTVYSSRH